MSYERDFKGVWIPAAVWLDETLSITEKVMIAEIDSLDTSERGCYASNSHFAKFFGLSPSRVSEIINTLKERDLISVEFVRQGKQIVERKIHIKKVLGKPMGYSENTENPIRKTEGGYSEKAKENNTLMNNTKKQRNKVNVCSEDDDPIFEQIWSIYPAKPGRTKPPALRAYKARLKAGADPQVILDGVKAYAAFILATGTQVKFVKMLQTFLGPDEHYLADWSFATVIPNTGKSSIRAGRMTPDQIRENNKRAGQSFVDFVCGVSSDGEVIDV